MATPQETIIPFADLPDCAANCGPLFDANGACVPPITTEVDESCFCNHDAVAGFKTSAEGVCDEACTGDDGEDALVQIQNWFAETCDVEKVTASDGDDGDSDSSGDSGSGGTRGTSSTNVAGSGQSWVQMHWRWLVMIIVLALAIIVIWVLAFWWRRRHLRKKELKRSLGKLPATASWGPGAAPPEAEAAVGGVFNPHQSSPDSAGSPPEKPEKPGRSWWGGRKAG